MKCRLLKQEENSRTRELYEEVFPEDSKAFVDYYYSNMANHNKIWVIEVHGEIVSMLHLNPYQVFVQSKSICLYYIVAVATKECYRHRGYMRALLRESMENMYGQKLPFTYLMPASEAIYRPFGFTTIWNQNIYQKKEGRDAVVSAMEAGMDATSLPGVEARQEDLEELAVFANRRLKDNYSIYTERSPEYFERMMKEQNSENGRVMLLKEAQQLKGYYLTAQEESIQIREPVYEGDNFPIELEIQEQPKIMIRVLHMETILNLLDPEGNQGPVLGIKDEFLPKNTGTYQYGGNRNAGKWEKVKGTLSEYDNIKTPEQMTEELFLNTPLFLNEIV